MPACKYYKITSSSYRIVGYTPCCSILESPIIVNNTTKYICSSTTPTSNGSLGTIQITLVSSNCPTCVTPTPTPTPFSCKFGAPCVQYSVTNNTPNSDILRWTDCNGASQQSTLPGNTSKPTFCACNGSLTYQYSTVTILQGVCGPIPTPSPTPTRNAVDPCLTPSPTPTKKPTTDGCAKQIKN